MAVFKCKMCGGSVEFEAGAAVGVCDSCGTRQTLPKVSDEVVANLFNRATRLRLKAEFDKAAEIYEKIIDEDNTNAEAHWGLVLCKYGIEYVEDPATHKRVPTCHRAQYESVMTDPDYIAALENADAAQQGLYTTQALEISNLQKGILAIVKEEKPFDVFICYKETDENGRRTVDSALANDIYYQLTQEGLKVFYATITLEDKLGQEYEPYIFAALNSAKVMLVVGTKPEYFEAVWVRNEWSRFLKLLSADRSRLLIPCYRDMDAYDLPEEFAHLQAQDMAKIGFINDIVRGIRKVIDGGKPQKGTEKETVVVNAAGSASAASLLKRAFMFLEDGKWAEADEYCEKVLDQEPENARAYLGKLMAGLQVKQETDLKNAAEPFDGNDNCQKASRFDPTLDKKLKADNAFIRKRNENARRELIYQSGLKIMNAAKTEQEFKAAAADFGMIKGVKDADTLAKTCLEKAEIARKDAIYASAFSRISSDSIDANKAAINLFESILDWKDSRTKIDECNQKIEEIRIAEKKAEEERKRKAEAARLAAEKKKALFKKIAVIGGSILAALIVFLIVLNAVIIPGGKYKKAVALYDAGKYDEAITAFKAMDGYKDSAEQISKCETAIKDHQYDTAIALIDKGDYINAYEKLIEMKGYKNSTERAKAIFGEYKAEKLKNAAVGDIVYFGSYEQDNNTSNGKEGVDWLVLAREGNKALLISKYALDCKQYNTKYMSVTWETCSLRKWLNDGFINSAFSTEEQKLIQTMTVTADANTSYSTSPGKNTTDKVFLLSIAEANKYFTTDEARKCAPTDYAIAQGAYTSDSNSVGGRATGWWWLRSPGYQSVNAADVNVGGSLNSLGDSILYTIGGVRPALWINLES